MNHGFGSHHESGSPDIHFMEVSESPEPLHAGTPEELGRSCQLGEATYTWEPSSTKSLSVLRFHHSYSSHSATFMGL